MAKGREEGARLEHAANLLLRAAGGRRAAAEYPFYSESQLRRRRKHEVSAEVFDPDELPGPPAPCGAEETVEDVLERWLLPFSLTRRERRLLGLRAVGHTLREIARALRCSPQRVQRELRRLAELLEGRTSALALSALEAQAARALARSANTREIAAQLGVGVLAARRIVDSALRKLRAFRADEQRAIRQCYWEDVHRAIYRPPSRTRLRVVSRALYD